MSRNVTIYKLNSIKQLIDLNKDKKNFELDFQVESSDGKHFDALVVTQEMLDSETPLEYQKAEGFISGKIVADKDIYQNYFLLLKSHEPVECKVMLNIKDILPNLQENNNLPEQHKNNNFPPHKQKIKDPTSILKKPKSNQVKKSWFTFKNLIFLGLILLGAALLWYFYFYKKTDDKNEPTAIITQPQQMQYVNQPQPAFNTAEIKNEINARFDQISEAISDGVNSKISKNLSTINDNINNKISELGEGISTKVSNSLNSRVDTLNNQVDNLNNLVPKLTDGLNSKFENISNKVDGLGPKISDGISNKISESLAPKINDGISNKISELKDGLTNGISNKISESLAPKITDGISTKISESLAPKINDGISNKISELKDGLTNGMSELKEGITDGISSSIGEIKTQFEKIKIQSKNDIGIGNKNDSVLKKIKDFKIPE